MGFQEWAEESYDMGSLDEDPRILQYGAIVAVRSTVDDTGSLVEGAIELLGAGFTQLWSDAIEALRGFGLDDIATLLADAETEFDEGDPYGEATVADEQRREAIAARWPALGASDRIDALGEKLLAETRWSPPAD
ncbi:MAG: hypothetical protein Q4G67_08455 [Actinomycetia bacterium]|nr:hypothetical protein [Actinomycetes bacterium]